MSISKTKFNGAIKSFKRIDREVREALTTMYTFVAFHTLAHGNKAPLDQLKEANHIPAWVKAGANRAVMAQDVRYRTDTAAGWKLAADHADTVIGSLLDKRKDESEEAKAKREAAKAKREAEALAAKERERELEEAQNAQEKLELELAKAKAKLKEQLPKRTGGRVKRPDAEQPGKVEQEERFRLLHTLPQGDGKDEILDLTEEEYQAALAAVQALRKGKTKAA